MHLISCRFGDVKIPVLESSRGQLPCHAQRIAPQLLHQNILRFLIVKQYAEKHGGIFKKTVLRKVGVNTTKKFIGKNTGHKRWK